VGWTEDKITGVPGVLSKILGLLITAGAAMLGAPFWFDILKKVVNIRGVGVNPAEEPKATANRGNG
jgi:ascorbate-specific PTS system EIIC-type component UlaA